MENEFPNCNVIPMNSLYTEYGRFVIEGWSRFDSGANQNLVSD